MIFSNFYRIMKQDIYGENDMATVHSSRETLETVEHQFRRLEAIWLAESGHHSSTKKLIQHEAFQEILQLGKDVIPFMLRDLQEKPRLWVWALPHIAEVNPVSTADGADIAKMSEVWLRWGREQGYLR